MKKILFATLALAATAVAGAQTSKNLVVVDNEGRSTSWPADQVDGIMFTPMPEYIQLVDQHLLGYEEKGDYGYYHLELGTADADETGFPANIGDMQVVLNLCGPKSESLLDPVLPAGMYRVGTGAQPYTYDVTNSAIWIRVEEGPDGNETLPMIDGTVDVRIDDNGVYDIRMEFTTMAGDINLSYTGDLTFPGGYGEYNPFDQDVELTFSGAQGRFWGNWYYPLGADMAVQFYVGTIVDNNLVDGYILNMDFTEPIPANKKDPNPRVADGVYVCDFRTDVENNTYRPFTFNPGESIDFWGEMYPTKSYMTYNAPTGQRNLGLITGGTMTVSENGTKFVFNLTTENGHTVTGTYTGTPYIVNYNDDDENTPTPPYSTLDHNINGFNWKPTTVAYSYNYGHTIMPDLNTLTFMITDLDFTGGDYLQFDLLTEGETMADGTYTLNWTLEDNTALPGTIDYGGNIIFSWYGDLDSTDDEGYQDCLAALAGGTFTISTEADGSRKIVINVTDDAGNTIQGEFVTSEIFDISDSPAQVRKTKKTMEKKTRRFDVRPARR